MSLVRSIAVLRPAGLGDFIMSTPAFVQLRRRFPEARITLITMHSQSVDQAAKVRAYAGGERAAPWIELIRPHALDDVQVLPSIRDWQTFCEARRLMAEIRPDLIVQMMDPGTPYVRRVKKITLMLALCGFVRQIGWRQHGQILKANPPAVNPLLGHHVQGPLQFLRELDERHDQRDSDVVFDIRPGADAEAWARQWLGENGLIGRRLVAIAPGAIHDHKQWPLAKFESLIRALSTRFQDLHFLVVGTPKDAKLAQTLVEVNPSRIHDLCGQSSITQSAALFCHCALVVGNDGGAMHLADSVGATVVSIVPGLEYPVSIEPWHNQDHAIRHTIPCAPCYSFTFCPQGHRRCMLDLPLDRVFDRCIRVLEDARTSLEKVDG